MCTIRYKSAELIENAQKWRSAFTFKMNPIMSDSCKEFSKKDLKNMAIAIQKAYDCLIKQAAMLDFIVNEITVCGDDNEAYSAN